MADNMLVISEADLSAIMNKLNSIEAELARVRMTPAPKWVTVDEYARQIDRSPRTVLRRIEAGEIECRHEAGVRMVRSAVA